MAVYRCPRRILDGSVDNTPLANPSKQFIADVLYKTVQSEAYAEAANYSEQDGCDSYIAPDY